MDPKQTPVEQVDIALQETKEKDTAQILDELNAHPHGIDVESLGTCLE